MPTYSETMSGGVKINGIAELTATKKYFPSGLVVTTGSEAESFIFWHQNLLWDIVTNIDSSIEFEWNVGQQPLHYYRVLRCCEYTNPEGNAGAGTGPNQITPESPNYEAGGCATTGMQNSDPTCAKLPQKQFMLQTVIARDIPDLCNELAKQNYNWQICKVQRWSRPVDPTEPDPNPECNILEDISFDGVPECMQLNLQTNAVTYTEVTTILTELFYKYTGSGTVLAGGKADASIVTGGPTPTIAKFSYTSSGGSTKFGGTALISSTWNNSLLTKILATTFLTIEEAFFGAQEDNAIAAPTKTINTNCVLCTALPSNLFVHHNFNNPSVYQNFIRANGFTPPTYLSFLYNERLESWLAHQHFTGFSSTGDGNELWRFSYELSCVNEVGGEDIDSFIIKFAISILRYNITNSLDYETKIIILFPSADFCGLIRNFKDDLIFDLNTATGLVTNTILTPQSIMINDGIGIFKSSYWVKNPLLKIRISTSSSNQTLARKDLSFILPQSVTQIQENGNFVNAPI